MPTGRQVFNQTLYGNSGNSGGGSSGAGVGLGGANQIAARMGLNKKKPRSKVRNRGRIKNRAKRK